VRPKKSRSLADLHVTLMKLMGVEVPSFGDPLYYGGPLPL
jgi:hypothetical protein